MYNNRHNNIVIKLHVACVMPQNRYLMDQYSRRLDYLVFLFCASIFTSGCTCDSAPSTNSDSTSCSVLTRSHFSNLINEFFDSSNIINQYLKTWRRFALLPNTFNLWRLSSYTSSQNTAAPTSIRTVHFSVSVFRESDHCWHSFHLPKKNKINAINYGRPMSPTSMIRYRISGGSRILLNPKALHTHFETHIHFDRVSSVLCMNYHISLNKPSSYHQP